MNAFKRVRTLAMEMQNLIPAIQSEAERQYKMLDSRPFSLEREAQVANLQNQIERAMMALLNVELAAERLDKGENSRVLELLASMSIDPEQAAEITKKEG